MENEAYKPPCHNCITLPICIQRYKNCLKTMNTSAAISVLEINCTLLYQDFYNDRGYYAYHGNSKIKYLTTIWWRNNYGR